MLKILLVYYEPLPSGQTTHVLSLACGLNRAQFEVTVVLPDGLLASIEKFRQAGVKVIPIKMEKIFWPAASLLALGRLMRQEHFDVVHIHSQEAGLIARLLARLSGAQKIFYTPQTIDIRRRQFQVVYSSFEYALAHLTDRIISVNEADRLRMIRWGISSQKIIHIPNGIEICLPTPSTHPAELKRDLSLEEDCLLVMQVGRLSAQKNPLAFVEGASQVARGHPRARFLLFGEGALKGEVEQRIHDLGMDGVIRTAGWHPNVRRLMPAADVVTLTSRWEGTPYSLLEAMAASRPVLSTDVNGCVEIIQNGTTGFLSPAGDIPAWSARLNGLLDDPKMREEMGRQGRKLVEASFSLDDMIERISALYFSTSAA